MQSQLHEMAAAAGDPFVEREPTRRERLEAAGFIVGDRDPGRNRAWEGRYMVAEPLEPGDAYPTDDASDGPWCVVGDDLDVLIADTCSFFEL